MKTTRKLGKPEWSIKTNILPMGSLGRTAFTRAERKRRTPGAAHPGFVRWMQTTESERLNAA